MSLRARIASHPTYIAGSPITEAIILFAGVAIWAFIGRNINSYITPRCASDFTSCAMDTINAIDRLYVGDYDGRLDHLSFITQYAAGVVAVIAPTYYLSRRRQRAEARNIPLFLPILIFLQTLIWNGLLNSLIRVIVQRPRPFVYLDPKAFGALPSHYTSFVSGHTSFAMAASLGMIAMLSSLGPENRSWHRFALWNAVIWVGSTAILRVLAGRHFITDTLGAMGSGALVAIAVAYLHRNSRASPTACL